jgi:hypothetical protein
MNTMKEMKVDINTALLVLILAILLFSLNKEKFGTKQPGQVRKKNGCSIM